MRPEDDSSRSYSFFAMLLPDAKAKLLAFKALLLADARLAGPRRPRRRTSATIGGQVRAAAPATRRRPAPLRGTERRARSACGNLVSTIAPRLGNSFWPFFRRRRRQIAAGADYGGAPPAHVLAPPRPPMMRAHPPALPLAIRAAP